MQNLFRILDIKKDELLYEYLVELANKEHSFFQAHFPNNEILAGFLQIDIIANILEHKVKKIKKAKFLALIKPNDKIRFLVTTKDKIVYKVVIKDLLEIKLSEFVYEI